MKDTRTPVKVSFWTLLINVAAGLLLMRTMGHAGLALALTISSIFNAIMLTLLLSRRLGDLELKVIWQTFLRMIPGLVLMTLVVNGFLDQIDWLNPGSFWISFVVLGSAVVCGALIYIACLWILGVKEMRQAWALFADRLPHTFRRG